MRILYSIDLKSGEIKKDEKWTLMENRYPYFYDDIPVITKHYVVEYYGDKKIYTEGVFSNKILFFLCDNCNEYHYITSYDGSYFASTDLWDMSRTMHRLGVKDYRRDATLKFLATHSPDPVKCLVVEECRFVHDLLVENAIAPPGTLFSSDYRRYIHRNFHNICRHADDPELVYRFLRLPYIVDYVWFSSIITDDWWDKYGKGLY